MKDKGFQRNKKEVKMEAMSIETLLLSAWEEEGFVGKTRVPLGQSDVDVVAIHANNRSEQRRRISEYQMTQYLKESEFTK